jgi:hypothetical protein
VSKTLSNGFAMAIWHWFHYPRLQSWRWEYRLIHGEEFEAMKTPEERLTESVGWYAYDQGATDSGIHDDLAKDAFFDWLHEFAKDTETERLTLSRWIRDYWLSEEALAQGYGIEDVKSYLEWLCDNGYCV